MSQKINHNNRIIANRYHNQFPNQYSLTINKGLQQTVNKIIDFFNKTKSY